MEKYPNTMVIPSDFGWNDIGSYTALADVFEADEDGNIIKGEIKNVDSKNNIIIDSGGKKISILGIEGLIIVQSENDILITTKESAQDIKKLLK